MQNITLMLEAMQRGQAGASDRFMTAVYGELRSLAAARLADDRAGQTLQPTALVHEAWLRLGGDQQPAWRNRAHFFSAAAEAMRRILIDRARRGQRQRHGNGQRPVSLDEVDEPAAARTGDELLALNEALGRFALRDQEKAELVKLRYFIGLSFAEAAEVLGVSESTAKRWWAFSRAWLYRELQAVRRCPN